MNRRQRVAERLLGIPAGSLVTRGAIEALRSARHDYEHHLAAYRVTVELHTRFLDQRGLRQEFSNSLVDQAAYEVRRTVAEAAPEPPAELEDPSARTPDGRRFTPRFPGSVTIDPDARAARREHWRRQATALGRAGYRTPEFAAALQRVVAVQSSMTVASTETVSEEAVTNPPLGLRVSELLRDVRARERARFHAAFPGRLPANLLDVSPTDIPKLPEFPPPPDSLDDVVDIAPDGEL